MIVISNAAHLSQLSAVTYHNGHNVRDTLLPQLLYGATRQGWISLTYLKQVTASAREVNGQSSLAVRRHQSNDICLHCACSHTSRLRCGRIVQWPTATRYDANLYSSIQRRLNYRSNKRKTPFWEHYNYTTGRISQRFAAEITTALVPVPWRYGRPPPPKKKKKERKKFPCHVELSCRI